MPTRKRSASRWREWIGGLLLVTGLCGLGMSTAQPQPRLSADEANAILAQPAPPKAAGNAEAAAAWQRRLDAARVANKLELQVEALRQLADAQTDGESRYRMLDGIASAYARAGQVPRQLATQDEIVGDRKIGTGRRAIVAANLALSQALAGETARSLRMAATAKSLAKDATAEEIDILPNEPLILALRADATIAWRKQDLPLAVDTSTRIVEESLAGMQDAGRSAKRRDAAGRNYLLQVWDHSMYLSANNRRQEALLFTQKALERFEAAASVKPSPTERGRVAYATARSYATLGAYAKALESCDAAMTLFEQARLPAQDNNLNLTRRQRALVKLALGRVSETGDDLRAMQAARAASPVFAGNSSENELQALLLAQQGDWKAAAAKAAEASAITLRWNGSDSSFYKSAVAFELTVLLNDPGYAPSKATVARYVDGLASSTADWSDGTQRGLELEYAVLEGYVELILRNGGNLGGEDATDIAFKIAELLKVDASQGALADGAAKMAAANPELRALIEREQALRADRSDSRRLAAIAASNADRLANQGGDELVQKRQRADADQKAKVLQGSEGKLVELRREIAQRFPVYRELVSPRIPTAAELARALGPGEAYVNLYPGRVEGYAFVVTPDGRLSATRVAVGASVMQQRVSAYKKYFEQGLPPSVPGRLEGLDLAAGLQLYRDWLAPLKAQLGSASTLYLAAGDALAAVPWSALPTLPAGTLKDAHWTAQDHAFVQMPSASSLLLTRTASAAPARNALLAFADPSFDGRDAAPAKAVRAIRTSAVRSAAATPQFDYRQVSPLPETLVEARAIATSLGADPAVAVLHGPAASRSRALKPDLLDARVLAFATHGLLPGEIPGYGKHGLAMAYEGRGLADSILSIDDIANLRLNAQWVLLSACNTGYRSGTDVDSVSALARAFFAAGAKSLLVTGWAVDSESAMQLTVGTFQYFASAPSENKASALAHAQRDMLAGKQGELFRHPYFWGAYFLVGHANR